MSGRTTVFAAEQDSIAGAAEDKFLSVEPGHDRLARARIVGEQEAEPLAV
jgi:hypothetical protein